MIRTDEQIKQDVINQLRSDGIFDQENVTVAVENGKVILSGVVPTPESGGNAIGDAWSVEGVKAVINKLAVKFANSVPTDEEIRAQVASIITWTPGLDIQDSRAIVIAGHVTLEGMVTALWKKHEVEDRIRGIVGVADVTNKIAVVPTGDPTDRRIANDIEEALHGSIDVDINDVDVTVRNGDVTLTGWVPDASARNAAHDVVVHTPEVRSVHNELEIRSMV